MFLGGFGAFSGRRSDETTPAINHAGIGVVGYCIHSRTALRCIRPSACQPQGSGGPGVGGGGCSHLALNPAFPPRPYKRAASIWVRRHLLPCCRCASASRQRRLAPSSPPTENRKLMRVRSSWYRLRRQCLNHPLQ